MSPRTAPRFLRDRSTAAPIPLRPQRPQRVHNVGGAAPLLLASDEVVELTTLDGEYDDDFASLDDDIVDLEDASTLSAPRPAAPTPTVQTAVDRNERKSKKPEKVVERLTTSRITEQDAAIFEALDWMGRASLTHVAYALDYVRPNGERVTGNSAKNLEARMRDLIKRGFVTVQGRGSRARDLNGLLQYGATKNALNFIGVEERPMVDPSEKTLSHRAKINSAVIWMRLDEDRLFELRYKDEIGRWQKSVSDLNSKRDQERRNEMNRQRILTLPEHLRTEDDIKDLARKPAVIREDPPMPQPMYGTRKSWPGPQAAFSERIMLRDQAIWGEAECRAEFEEESQDLLNSETFPRRWADDDTDPTEEEIEASYAEVDGRSWLFQHQDPKGKFGKRHTPDGVALGKRHMPDAVMLRPHRVHQDENGNLHLSGGSYWVEIEDHRKKLEEVLRVCKQAMDHPLTRGVIYMTMSRSVANLVKKVKKRLIAEEAASIRLNANGLMGTEQATALATEKVNDAILLKTPPLINDWKNAAGYWG